MQRGAEGQSTMSDIPARTTSEAVGQVWRKKRGYPAVKETTVMSSVLHRAWGLRRGSIVRSFR